MGYFSLASDVIWAVLAVERAIRFRRRGGNQQEAQWVIWLAGWTICGLGFTLDLDDPPLRDLVPAHVRQQGALVLVIVGFAVMAVAGCGPLALRAIRARRTVSD